MIKTLRLCAVKAKHSLITEDSHRTSSSGHYIYSGHVYVFFQEIAMKHGIPTSVRARKNGAERIVVRVSDGNCVKKWSYI